ncbi:MAG: PQQ-binding-like beta-propeller repeat protein [Alphaproteobacteria bacterium]
MLKNKTVLAVFSMLILNSCSSVSGMFDKDEEQKLEGKRISVLELQKTLKPDVSIENQNSFPAPAEWSNASWPQTGGYPNHSMQNPALPNTQLKRIWSSDIGAGSSGDLPLTAQPIVANNAVYTLDTDSRLSAFNAATGKLIWKTNVEKEDEGETVISGGISFAHGLIYVTNGYDEVIAVSPDNGEIQWRKRLPAPSRAAPTVIGGRVFVSTVDSRLVALSAKDGASLWEYTGISETTGLLGAASPAANSDIVVPVFSSGEVTALRVENGSVAWSDNLASVRRYGGGLESMSDIKAMPILDNGIIVSISFGGKLAAINERTGARIWQREVSGSQTPWVSGQNLYVLSSDNQVIAINITNGSILWIQELDRFEDPDDREDPIYWSGPVMGSDRLVITGSHGYFVEIDARNGDIMRTTKTKKSMQISPIIADKTLYILADDGTLMAYK